MSMHECSNPPTHNCSRHTSTKDQSGQADNQIIVFTDSKHNINWHNLAKITSNLSKLPPVTSASASTETLKKLKSIKILKLLTPFLKNC